MDAMLRDLGSIIEAELPDAVTSVAVRHGELTVAVKRDSIVQVLGYLRDSVNCQFKQLMDICGVDYPEHENRFEVVYNLLSLTHNLRVRVTLQTNEDDAVPTVTGVYSSAGWFEREAWDLYGIYFSGHPDLRRILTDYGFEGHPLRKDFPLTGYVEIRYDDEKKRVVYEPVKFTQEFRTFDFVSPWEGVQAQLPGDEKADGADDANDGGAA
ncbi:MAG: NADH-quinone oxidoreductase subunit C [Rhodospirillales bacterium]|nr:NADH-quinone oxidoreductase subunit C [Rhodospirillales bacterium]